MKIVTSKQMAQIERRSVQAGVSLDRLMENAGLSIAMACRRALGLGQDEGMPGSGVLILAGPGNNGGDGLVAARHLAGWGADTTVYLGAEGRDPHPKIADLPEAVRVVRVDDDPDLTVLRQGLSGCGLAVDALLGTGTSRPLTGRIADLMAALAEARSLRPELLLVAADLPTGVSGDTGEADPASVRSDITVALGRPKIGHCTMPGAQRCGMILVDDIGIPRGLDEDVELSLITPDWAEAHLPPRPAEGHKGTFGRVLVVAGCRSYVGAAVLAAAGACRVGAGLVTAAVPAGIQMAMVAAAPQVTYLPLPETPGGGISPDGVWRILPTLGSCDALAVGCGLGQEEGTGRMLVELLTSGRDVPPAVVDADALNLLSAMPGWHRRLASPAILTPHPGEMSRLDDSPAAAGFGRISWARDAATAWDKIVVLKGAHTVVAFPGGRAMIAPFANPGMATAGTGDVLTGVIAGLLAQGVAPPEAAALGVYLHGIAGDAVRDDLGDAGMIATDLLIELPRAIRSLAEG